MEPVPTEHVQPSANSNLQLQPSRTVANLTENFTDLEEQVILQNTTVFSTDKLLQRENTISRNTGMPLAREDKLRAWSWSSSTGGSLSRTDTVPAEDEDTTDSTTDHTILSRQNAFIRAGEITKKVEEKLEEEKVEEEKEQAVEEKMVEEKMVEEEVKPEQ